MLNFILFLNYILFNIVSVNNNLHKGTMCNNIMNYYLYDFEEEIDYDKIIIGDKIKLENNSYRHYIYYLDTTPKDFYITLPSIKLIYSYKNNKYNQIKIPLYPMYDKINKLVYFLKKLKRKIKELNKTEKKYSNSIEKKDNLQLLKININNNFKVTCQNDKLDIKELKTLSEIYGIINIPYIWENENSYGLSLNISKMVYIPKIEDDFVDFVKKPTYTPSIVNYITDPNKFINNTTNNNIYNKEAKIQFKVSTDLLLQMKNKLNKIN